MFLVLFVLRGKAEAAALAESWEVLGGRQKVRTFLTQVKGEQDRWGGRRRWLPQRNRGVEVLWAARF